MCEYDLQLVEVFPLFMQAPGIPGVDPAPTENTHCNTCVLAQ